MQGPNLVSIKKQIEEAVGVVSQTYNVNKLLDDTPILCYRMTKDRYQEGDIGELSYPFQKFRFSIQRDGLTLNGFFKGLVNYDGVIVFTCRFPDFEMAKVMDTVVISLQMKRPSDFLIWIKNRGNYVLNKDVGMRKYARNIVWHALKLFEAFSIDYMSPSNQIVSVKPDKQGKSVEWTKAREHYTIIHRTHSANDKRLAIGAVVNNDDKKQILRIAHSRRAHVRLLKNPKFKRDANGAIRQVTVKDTWCGPKEWKDGSGQIYKIVDKAAKTSS